MTVHIPTNKKYSFIDEARNLIVSRFFCFKMLKNNLLGILIGVLLVLFLRCLRCNSVYC